MCSSSLAQLGLRVPHSGTATVAAERSPLSSNSAIHYYTDHSPGASGRVEPAVLRGHLLSHLPCNWKSAKQMGRMRVLGGSRMVSAFEEWLQ